jgi:hypothetical protein
MCKGLRYECAKRRKEINLAAPGARLAAETPNALLEQSQLRKGARVDEAPAVAHWFKYLLIILQFQF